MNFWPYFKYDVTEFTTREESNVNDEHNNNIKKTKEHSVKTTSAGIEAASGHTRVKFFLTHEVSTERTDTIQPTTEQNTNAKDRGTATMEPPHTNTPASPATTRKAA